VPVRWWNVRTTVTLPLSARWLVRSITRSERRRGRINVRKHDVRRNHMLEVVREHLLSASGHVLLRIDDRVQVRLYRCVVLNL
jgi:hypothetical protein